MKIRNAFTMIELVFVIVIMGILGKFGVEFLAQAYNNFIFSKVNNTLQSDGEAAVEFISNRLQYRIKDSIIARKASDNSFTALASASDSNYTILEWIGTDIDGFRGSTDNNYTPNWSGIADLDLSSNMKIYSPDTNISKINSFIKNLSNSGSDLNDSAIYFVGSSSDIVNGYGWSGAITDQNQTMHPIIGGTTFASNDGNFSEIYEYYKLAWSAYAVVHSSDGNLTLYYDYQPWNGEVYSNGKSSLLMQNVDTFQFMAVGSLVKIQVCVNTSLVEDYSLCKEKTIY